MTDIGSSRPAAPAFEPCSTRARAAWPNSKSVQDRRCKNFSISSRQSDGGAGDVLLLSVAAFGFIVGSRFLSMFNLSLIIQQVTIIGVIGAAQTLIVITAGIDLSVGAIMVLCSVIMGKLAVTIGLPAPVALFVGVAAGGLLRSAQRYARDPAQAAALHRNAWDMVDLLRAQSLVFGRPRPSVRRRSRKSRRCCRRWERR